MEPERLRMKEFVKLMSFKSGEKVGSVTDGESEDATVMSVDDSAVRPSIHNSFTHNICKLHGVKAGYQL